jgi:hypothetical protein
MSNFARVINGVAINVSADPANSFHNSIASTFIAVPDEVREGWALIDGTWQAPAAAAVVVQPKRPTVGPTEFKLLFKTAERLALKALKATDPVIEDIFDIIDDPRLITVILGLASTEQSVAYCLGKLVQEGVINSDDVAQRQEEILSGRIV